MSIPIPGRDYCPRCDADVPAECHCRVKPHAPTLEELEDLFRPPSDGEREP